MKYLCTGKASKLSTFRRTLVRPIVASCPPDGEEVLHVVAGEPVGRGGRLKRIKAEGWSSMTMLAGVPDDKWALVTGDNAFRQRDIEAFVAARGDIVALYAFWCNHIWCAPAGARELHTKLQELYELLVKVPLWTLTFTRLVPDGELRYINRDYYEDETNELNEIHRNKVEANVRDVYAAIQAIHEDVASTWNMSERVKTEYEAVTQKAFASVRKWLKIPDFKARSRREETGIQPSIHERLESLKYLGGPMNLVFDESCKLKVKNCKTMFGRRDYDTTIRWNRHSDGFGSLSNAL